MVPGTKAPEEALGYIPDRKAREHLHCRITGRETREEGAGARGRWAQVEGVKADS